MTPSFGFVTRPPFTPTESDIGYLLYGTGPLLPITSVQLVDGDTVLTSRVVTAPDASVSIDTEASVTVIGSDGSQIMHAGRHGLPPDMAGASYGGTLTVHQRVSVTEVVGRGR